MRGERPFFPPRKVKEGKGCQARQRMRNQELKDRIYGSVLKKEHLKAFLLQDAYIESLLKVYVDYE